MNHSIQETQNGLSLPHMGAPTSPAPILPVMLVQHHLEGKGSTGSNLTGGQMGNEKITMLGMWDRDQILLNKIQPE